MRLSMSFIFAQKSLVTYGNLNHLMSATMSDGSSHGAILMFTTFYQRYCSTFARRWQEHRA